MFLKDWQKGLNWEWWGRIITADNHLCRPQSIFKMGILSHKLEQNGKKYVWRKTQPVVGKNYLPFLICSKLRRDFKSNCWFNYFELDLNPGLVGEANPRKAQLHTFSPQYSTVWHSVPQCGTATVCHSLSSLWTWNRAAAATAAAIFEFFKTSNWISYWLMWAFYFGEELWNPISKRLFYFNPSSAFWFSFAVTFFSFIQVLQTFKIHICIFIFICICSFKAF